jgi:Ca2+-binding RTX toxin-like protein
MHEAAVGMPAARRKRTELAPDRLSGAGGIDEIWGCDGDDVLEGGDGNDFLLGGDARWRGFWRYPCVDQLSGNDSMRGDAGNDELWGCGGDDSLDGGADRDLASFAFAPMAVTANLDTGTATGDGNDSLVAIEDLLGSDFDDELVGNETDNRLDAGAVNQEGASDEWVGGYGRDTLIGGSGDDFLIGGVENDSLDGGSGTDRAAFQCDYWWKDGYNNTLNVDLSLQVAQGDGADLLAGIEDVEVFDSSRCDTTMVGSDEANRLLGGNGPNLISGGGGDDFIFGGDSRDTLAGGSRNGHASWGSEVRCSPRGCG